MPIYLFECPNCGKKYTREMKIDEPHVFECLCGEVCNRDYTSESVQVKKNEGFFSVSLGKEVRSQTEFERGLEEMRFKKDIAGELGDTARPDTQWEDEVGVEREAMEKESKDVDDYARAEGYYDSIETFKFEPEKYKERLNPQDVKV